MTTKQVIDKARELGFDALGALDVPQALAALTVWREHLREEDFFVRDLCIDPREEMPDTASVLVLAYPFLTLEGYPKGVGWVSGYYPAENRAYHSAAALAAWMREQGVAAIQSREMPLKPLAQAAGLGRYGRNGLIVRRGSHMTIQALLCDLPAGDFPAPQTEFLPCESCGRCEVACPSGALSGGLVDASRCLRTYMGRDIPPDLRPLMGERLQGCDECLNACPGMKKEPMPEEWAELFSWEALEDEARFAKNKSAIADLLGVNYAGKMREKAMKLRGET